MDAGILGATRPAIALGVALALCGTDVPAQSLLSRSGVVQLASQPGQPAFSALRDSARRRPADGPLQFRFGLAAWAAAEQEFAGRDGKLPADALIGLLALDALRKATAASPDSARFWLAYIRLSNAMERPVPAQAYRVAREAANGSRDSALRAETLTEFGRHYWRVYDGYANRALRLTSDPSRSVGEAVNPLGRSGEAVKEGSAVSEDVAAELKAKAEAGQIPMSLYDMLATPRQDLEQGELPKRASLFDARDQVLRELMPLPPGESGEGAYLRAEDLFREALAIQPGHAFAFRQLAMLLAERSRWSELRSIAERHTAVNANDATGWMTLGLATHRLHQNALAEEALDSALARLDPTERARLDRVERVLNSSARERLHALDSASRASLTNVLWAAADPLWSKRGGEPRTEFLARVAFAELRWTVDDLRVRGADTDRGDSFIRWGPPNLMVATGPPVGDIGIGYVVTTFWWYDWGLLLAFEGPPRLGVARVAFGDDEFLARTRESVPVRWDNIVNETVDPMPVQVARFRAGADSISILVAGSVPADSIHAASDVTGPVRADFWLIGGDQRTGVRDSVIPVARGGATTIEFRQSVPRGNYLYRAEATADGSLHAAQATGLVGADGADGLPATGVAMSDVLLASSAAVPPVVRRWSDIGITPLVGAVSRDGAVTLVWENYEFAADSGTARYTVDVTIAPERGTARVVLRALGELGRALVGAGGDGDGRVTFERVRPHAAVMPDHVIVGLAGTPPGRYELTVRVTDRVGGTVLERTAPLQIR